MSADAAKPRRSTLRIVTLGLLRGIMVGVAVVLATLLLVTVVVPKLTASPSYTITGRSMEPTIDVGSLIITRTVAPEAVRIGDIITFQLESGLAPVATHRVVGFEFTPNDEKGFITQGDNNETADAQPVRPAQLQGRLWYTVPYVGWLSTAVNAEARGWLLPLATAALLGYGTWTLVRGIIERRRTGTAVGQTQTQTQN